MKRLVSVVDLSNGMVTDFAPGVPTLDVPDGMGSGEKAVSIDGVGLLHFGSPDGGEATLRARTSPVSDRRPDERCLILADPGDRDRRGWQVYRLCVLEDAAPR